VRRVIIEAGLLWQTAGCVKSATGADSEEFPHLCILQTSLCCGLEDAEDRICRAAQRSRAIRQVRLHQNAGSLVWKHRKLKKIQLIKFLVGSWL